MLASSSEPGRLYSASRAGDGISWPAACLPWTDRPGGGRARECLLGKRSSSRSLDPLVLPWIPAMASSGCGSGADYHGRINRALDRRDSVGSIHVCHSQPPPRTSHMHPRQDLPAIHEVVE